MRASTGLFIASRNGLVTASGRARLLTSRRDDIMITMDDSGVLVMAGVDMRAGLLPPVVVLPNPSEPAGPLVLTGTQSALLAAARAAIAQLPVFDGPSALRLGLDAAWQTMAALAGAIPVSGPDPEQLPATAATQAYFRTRLAGADAQTAAAQSVAVIARCLEDLRYATVAGADLVRQTAAIIEVLDLLLQATESVARVLPQQRSELIIDDAGKDVPREHRWRCRWILAHQLHGVLSALAAAQVAAANRSIAAGDLDVAVGPLRTATVLVEGMAATRAHAAAFPPGFYNDVLRPSMSPPANPAALSGAMHPESRIYRREVRRLLEIEPAGYDELAARHSQLAAARERLLNADLIDAERHVCLVEAMIRTDHSLAQPEHGSDNGISALRTMRHRQALAYAPFVRYGDTLGR
jgi:hypothetical protein